MPENFHDFVYKNNLKKVEEELIKNPQLANQPAISSIKKLKNNSAYFPGELPLFIALENHHKEMVNLLINFKADPFQKINKGPNKGWSPLVLACLLHQKELVKFFLEKNSEKIHEIYTLTIHNIYYENINLLGIATVRENNDEIATLLIEMGAIFDKPFVINNKGTLNPFWVAIHLGKESLVKIFLQKIKLFSLQDQKILLTKALLILIVSDEFNTLESQTSITKLLIDAGADLKGSYDNKNPVLESCKNKKIQILDVMHNAGIDFNNEFPLTSQINTTPLFIAAQNTTDTVLLMYLLRKNIDITKCIFYEKLHANLSPLSFAIDCQNDSALRIFLNLLKREEYFPKRQKILTRALITACVNDRINQLQIILEFIKNNFIFDINTCIEYSSADYLAGTTPIFVAAEKGCLSSVKLLVENGANVNQINGTGTSEVQNKTPLMAAVIHKHQHIVSFLLEVGADPSITTKEKDTENLLSAPIAAVFFDNVLLLQKLIKNTSHQKYFFDFNYLLFFSIVQQKNIALNFCFYLNVIISILEPCYRLTQINRYGFL